MSELTKEQVHILQHSLGLTRGTEMYRNHFVTGPGSRDWDDCCALVEAGMMTKRSSSILPEDDRCFHVTDKGKAFVLELSEKS